MKFVNCFLALVLFFAFSGNVSAGAILSQPEVERAIQAVYPALIQIKVVVTEYDEGRERKQQAAGSGVIISPEGYAVTNHHVVGRASAIRVVLSSKEELEATLVGTDPLTDISVIRLNLADRPKGAVLPSAGFGDSNELKIGDPVLAMGSPLALSQSVTQGIVANRDMMMPWIFGNSLLLDGEDVGMLVKWIGHDAQILPGNSGGPLVNLRGEVIGINEISLAGGIAGAIPSDLVKTISKELIENGKVRRAWIGADFQPLLKTIPEDQKGVLVGGVLSGSPAEKAGLHAGDVVLSVDGGPVDARFREQLPLFHQLLLSKPVGSTVELRVLREGKESTLRVLTQLREDALGREQESREWGLVVEAITNLAALELERPSKEGVSVSSVTRGGPADQATLPLLPDDVIVEIGGKSVADKEAFFRITEEITRDRKSPVPTVVGIERKTEKLLSLVDIGIRTPQVPVPEARKAWLPVATQVLSRKLAAALGLEGKSGVRVTDVFGGSTAEAAGFRVGDVITKIDQETVEASAPQDSEVFESMIRQYRIGSTPVFTVVRDGKEMQITAPLVAQYKEERELPVYENVDLEFRARDISDIERLEQKSKQSGALVIFVQPGGWAAVGGLRPGDLIQEVNGNRVAQLSDLKSHLDLAKKNRAKQVDILIRSGVHSHFVELEPVWRDEAETSK